MTIVTRHAATIAHRTDDAATREMQEALKWYEHRSSHGRGRLTAESRELLRLGLLSLVWTSQVCWVLTITDKGRRLLAPVCFTCGRKESDCYAGGCCAFSVAPLVNRLAKQGGR